MKSRVLCTTAIEETWPRGKPVLFLGEWCRRHSRREAWSKLDHEVVPYHWDDRARLAADYQYLSALHERLLADLAMRLNELHGVDYGPRHWRIVAGFWLGTFVQIAFDRWTTIQDALAKFSVEESLTLAGAMPVANDSHEFVSLHIDDPWNHHLCATILREYTRVPCREVAAPPLAAATRRPPPMVNRLRRFLLRSWSRTLALPTGERDALLLNTYLPPSAEMRLNRRLNGLPQLWIPPAAPRVAVDPARRAWRLPGESASDFEECVRNLVARQIPATLLEGFAELQCAAATQRWPKKARIAWTSNDHRGDDVFTCWAAAQAEQGMPLVIGQHGGHYGTGAWCFAEDHDVAIADRYFSWGWRDARPNIVPLGEFIDIGERRPSTQARDEALLVTCSLPRYSYWLYSSPAAGQWAEYFEDQCRFVAALPEPVRAALRVRLYPVDFGWDQRQRWRERFPQLRIDDGATSMRALIDRSRLYIATYNATTFLETIAADVPTIIYWNPHHWELRESAQVQFQSLAAAGVFHATPESAARQVAAIWPDIDAWWRDAAVRRAVNAFKAEFCARPADLAARIEDALRGAARP